MTTENRIAVHLEWMVQIIVNEHKITSTFDKDFNGHLTPDVYTLESNINFGKLFFTKK